MSDNLSNDCIDSGNKDFENDDIVDIVEAIVENDVIDDLDTWVDIDGTCDLLDGVVDTNDADDNIDGVLNYYKNKRFCLVSKICRDFNTSINNIVPFEVIWTQKLCFHNCKYQTKCIDGIGSFCM